MRKVIKLLIFTGLLIPIITLSTQHAAAESKGNAEITIPVEDTLSPYPNFATGRINPIELFANSYLLDGNSSIKISGGKLIISGDTLSKVVADQVTVRLTVQHRKGNSGKWVDFVSGGIYSRTNTTYVNGSKTINASSGYQYRIRAYHLVKNNGKAEQAYSYSNIVEMK